MSTKATPVRIIGATTCSVGVKAGHDGDCCRANALSDGGILCVICGTTYPAAIAQVFESLRGVDVRVSNIDLGSKITRDTPPNPAAADNPHVLHISPYDAACLSGYDPAQFVMTRLELVGADSVVGSIRYNDDDAAAAFEPTNNFGRAFDVNEFGAIPDSASKLAAALAKNKFVVTGFSEDNGLSTLILARGNAIVGSKIIPDPAGNSRGIPVPDPEKLCIFGIRAEVQWRS